MPCKGVGGVRECARDCSLAHLCLLHRPIVLISSLNLSRQALVDLAQPVRQDAQVLLDFGFFFFLFQYLPVHLSKPSRKERRREETRVKGGGKGMCSIMGPRNYSTNFAQRGTPLVPADY